MTQTETTPSSSTQRTLALVVLVAVGIVSLPVTAYFLDDEGRENWIIPVQLVGMVLVGAAVGALLPGLARAGSTRGRAARTGALIGLALGIVGTLVLFLLISGFDGA